MGPEISGQYSANATYGLRDLYDACTYFLTNGTNLEGVRCKIRIKQFLEHPICTVYKVKTKLN